MIQLLIMYIIYTFFILLSDFAYAEKIAVNPVLNFKKIDSLPLVGSYGGAVIDSGGWLWLSSDSYLYRTNGDITYTYDLNKKNSAHLLDVPISTAFIDSKSRMGFGSFKGLSFYNSEANTFRHILGDTSKIDKLENGYPHGMINTYFQDSTGREWLGHVRYLTLYNPDDQTFINFSPWENEVNADTDALGALYPGISDIEEADDGSLWLSTVRNGLLKFDPDSGTYEIYRTFRPSDIYIKQIYALEWHSATELILATSDGLVLFNLNSKQFSRYPEHSPFLGQLNNVKQSRLGGYWITAGSLYHLSKEDSMLKYPMKGWAGPLIEQSDGTVVVTFGSGHTYATSPEMNQVNFFDLETESIDAYAQDGEVIYLSGKERIIKYSLKNNLIESIKLPVNDCQITALQVEKGFVFAAGCGQFFIIDKYNRKKIATVSIPINSNRSLYNYVSKIVSTGNGKLWLSAANFGLLEFDQKTSKFNILKKINDALFLENFASQSVEVSGNLAIVSTQARGFSFIDVNSKKILARHDPNEKNYPLPIRMIKELIKMEGAIYILHNSSSISKVDIDNMTAEAQALPFGSPLFCGSNDKGEALYYSDDRNIYAFKNNTSTLKFDQNNGMRNDITVRSCFIYHNELFLVGNQGLLRAKLNEKTDYRKPKVNFTKLYINHREVPVNSDILPSSLDYTDSITLDFNQRTMALEFTSTQLIPAQTRYYYKLDGYDSDWISSSKPRAQYTQIPWGRYVFRVKSEKNKLPSEERAIDIIVGAPWWIAWYMQCIYLILTVVLIWLFRNFSQIERKRLAALVKNRTSEIEKMNRQQKELYENLSHELNSPLTGINAIAHSVPDKQQSQRLFWHTMSMQKLIRQILDISRWANSHRLEKFRTDIGELASDLVQSFHDSIEKKNISLSINILQPAIANCNADAIEKAMANIISNAIKYNKENGSIHLGVSKDNDHVKISVMDSGVGIMKEDKAHLFDRFFRGKNTEHQPGSGIGLALTKAVIDAHGGTIEVESKTNEGSTFTISLPIGKPSKKQKTTAKVSTLADALTPDNNRPFDPNTDINAFDSKKKTLLIVEDISYILSYIVDTLNDKYNIVTAVNGQDGYEKALEQLPDLIISDIMMPVLNGYRLLEKVRADKLISHIPVIFLTAKIDRQSLEKSYGLTANDYIFKPFTQSQLLVRVESQLSHVDNIKSHYGLNAKIIVDDLLISKLDSFLSKNFSDEKLTIPDICNALAMSERNFQRKLKNLLGASPVEYLKKYRLERSRELMQSDKTLSIEALSERCGFSSPGYFSVCFRKQYDISPSKYYKSLNDCSIT